MSVGRLTIAKFAILDVQITRKINRRLQQWARTPNVAEGESPVATPRRRGAVAGNYRV